MRVVPGHRGINEPLRRRLRWKRARIPARRRLPKMYRPENRTIERPSARVSLTHLAATIGVALVLWALGALFQTAYAARIYPHVTIDHVPVGGMTRDEALAALQRTKAPRAHSPIRVRAAGRSWTVTPAQFGARYAVAGAVDRALALDRGGPPLIGGWNEVQTLFGGSNVDLSGAHDGTRVARFLTAVARAVHVSPKRAVVGVAGDDVAIVRQPVPGHRLAVAAATDVLGRAIDRHDTTDVTLPLQEVDSALGRAQAQAALDQAHALLASPISFLWTAGQAKAWQLTPRGMVRLLTFTPRCGVVSCRFDMGINAAKLSEAFNRSGVAASVDRPPQPATYQLVTLGNVPSVRVDPDTPGQAIDVSSAAADVLQQADTAPHVSRTIYVPTRPIYSSFNVAAATALNFNQAVGVGSLQYNGLDWSHIVNLNVAAKTINANPAIVQPGHTLKLSSLIGPLTATNAYTNGLNSIGPDDITGVNSGVEGLSSAVLSSAFDAGLPIVRRVHYPYTSAFTAPGLDAMVGYGKGAPDLAFRNTTDHPILVMTQATSTGAVTVYIFNTAGYAPDHRRSSYSSSLGQPDVTLNPDGSVDTTIGRTLTVGNRTTYDSLTSHYQSIDP